MKHIISIIVFAIISMVAKAQPSVNSEANVSEEGVRADTRPNMDFANVEYYIQFLGVHVDSIPQISDYKKQMRIEEDDEGAGVTRKSLCFCNGNETLLAMETNWLDTTRVDRITICSDKIKWDKVYVGQTMGEVKRSGHYSVVPCQDGVLLLRSESNKNVVLNVDISKEPLYTPLWCGECSVKDIPDSLRIENIILSVYDKQ